MPSDYELLEEKAIKACRHISRHTTDRIYFAPIRAANENHYKPYLIVGSSLSAEELTKTARTPGMNMHELDEWARQNDGFYRQHIFSHFGLSMHDWNSAFDLHVRPNTPGPVIFELYQHALKHGLFYQMNGFVRSVRAPLPRHMPGE
jgi:hypothetical protein